MPDNPPLSTEARAIKILRRYGYGPTLAKSLNPDELARFAAIIETPDPDAAHREFTAAMNDYHEARKSAADEPAPPADDPTDLE